MKVRPLGRTGLQVSELALGTWAFGGDEWGPADDNEAIATIEAAIDAGVNLLDTADVYGYGHSERLVGRVLRRRSERVYVCSKGGNDVSNPARVPGGSGKNFTDAYLRGAVHASLSRLGLDAIDVYLLHNPSLEVLGRGDVFETLRTLREQGRVRFAGVSVYSAEEGRLAMDAGGVDVLMLTYNLIAQDQALALLPDAAERGVGVIARSPLANGLLTGKYGPDSVFASDDHRAHRGPEWLGDALSRIADVREPLAGAGTLTQSALAFVLSETGLSSVAVGAKNRAQLAENLAAVQLAPLPEGVLGAIEQVRARWPSVP
jgi:aryl-alcohol dehydrogenase-like predicted oxidoreductase